ncbi:Methylmalonyl-CoA decarboxylase [Citrobacter freundii]|nr:Methylmalonyl-CoA decarboxylase [Citrobacter freundii]
MRTFAASFCALRVEPSFLRRHDIHELPTGRRDPLSYDDPLRQITRMIQKYPKPVISMVEGSVWGGAFEMIMSSDLIIAAETSTFSMTPGQPRRAV